MSSAARTPPLWLLVLITTSGTLGIHVFVPALPQAAEQLRVDTGPMQLTISLYILGLAIGQLGYGPLSDRFGRRPVLLAGLGLYTLAGVAGAFASGIVALVSARLVQALGGCAGLALGRAMVRDTAAPQQAAAKLAILNMVVSAGPGLAPLVGTALTETLGWRSVLGMLSVLGAATILLARAFLPETNPASQSRSVVQLARDYRRLLVSPRFLGYAIGGGCATTSWYAFLAASPFIFVHQLGRPLHELGVYYILLVLGTALGNLLASRLSAVVPLTRLLLGASLAGVAGTGFFLFVVLGGHMTVWTTMAGPLLFTVGVGIASPLALTRAVSVNPTVIGSAAGLYGFSQMGIGALCAALAGIGGNPALAAAVTLVVATSVGLGCFLLALWGERR